MGLFSSGSKGKGGDNEIKLKRKRITQKLDLYEVNKKRSVESWSGPVSIPWQDTQSYLKDYSNCKIINMIIVPERSYIYRDHYVNYISKISIIIERDETEEEMKKRRNDLVKKMRDLRKELMEDGTT